MFSSEWAQTQNPPALTFQVLRLKDHDFWLFPVPSLSSFLWKGPLYPRLASNSLYSWGQSWTCAFADSPFPKFFHYKCFLSSPIYVVVGKSSLYQLNCISSLWPVFCTPIKLSWNICVCSLNCPDFYSIIYLTFITSTRFIKLLEDSLFWSLFGLHPPSHFGSIWLLE